MILKGVQPNGQNMGFGIRTIHSIASKGIHFLASKVCEFSGLGMCEFLIINIQLGQSFSMHPLCFSPCWPQPQQVLPFANKKVSAIEAWAQNISVKQKRNEKFSLILYKMKTNKLQFFLSNCVTLFLTTLIMGTQGSHGPCLDPTLASAATAQTSKPLELREVVP